MRARRGPSVNAAKPRAAFAYKSGASFPRAGEVLPVCALAFHVCLAVLVGDFSGVAVIVSLATNCCFQECSLVWKRAIERGKRYDIGDERRFSIERTRGRAELRFKHAFHALLRDIALFGRSEIRRAIQYFG